MLAKLGETDHVRKLQSESRAAHIVCHQGLGPGLIFEPEGRARWDELDLEVWIR